MVFLLCVRSGCDNASFSTRFIRRHLSLQVKTGNESLFFLPGGKKSFPLLYIFDSIQVCSFLLFSLSGHGIRVLFVLRNGFSR